MFDFYHSIHGLNCIALNKAPSDLTIFLEDCFIHSRVFYAVSYYFDWMMVGFRDTYYYNIDIS